MAGTMILHFIYYLYKEANRNKINNFVDDLRPM